MFKYGVASLIWTEDFSKNGVPLIAKAKSLGFDVIDISMTNTEKFPSKAVKKAAKDAGIEVVTTIGMPRDCNLIDPDPAIRGAHLGLIASVLTGFSGIADFSEIVTA